MSDNPPSLLSDAVAEFTRVASAIAVGTCDAQARPLGMRAVALRVSPAQQLLTVFLAKATSAPLVRNLAENPRLAVTLSNPLDYRTLQFKGRVRSVADAPPDDEAFVRAFIARLAHIVDPFGMPRELVHRMSHWPAVALAVDVDEVFLQTPGPGAGHPLAGRTP